MTAQIFSQAKFAEIAGISGARVTVLRKGRLRGACSGKRMDMSHRSVREYLAERGVEYPVAAPNKPEKKPVVKPKKHAPAIEKELKLNGDVSYVVNVPDNIRDMLDKTLQEIFHDFGTDIRFFDWVKACKAIEDVHEKRVKTAKVEGEYIPRALVETHVFAAISDINTRLLSDSARTIAARVIESHDSGETRETIEGLVRSILSAQLRNMKQKAEGALDRAALLQ